MNAIKVRKRLELSGSDERDLERRIDSLRQAVRQGQGTILDIRWDGGGARSARRASVLYQVPLSRADLVLRDPG